MRKFDRSAYERDTFIVGGAYPGGIGRLRDDPVQFERPSKPELPTPTFTKIDARLEEIRKQIEALAAKVRRK